MNRLKGNITSIDSQDGLSLITINVEGVSVNSIIIFEPTESEIYKVDSMVELLFKETEVIVSTGNSMEISLQNCFECEIDSIKKGKLMSEVKLNFAKSSLTAVITTLSTDRLSLSVGKKVKALVKTNEIMISKC